MFTSGSNALTTGKKRLTMSHVWVIRGQQKSRYDRYIARRATLWLIADKLETNKDSVHPLWSFGQAEDLFPVCATCAADNQKGRRMKNSEGVITLWDQELPFLQTLITGNETWYYQQQNSSGNQWNSVQRILSSPKTVAFRSIRQNNVNCLLRQKWRRPS